MHKPAFRRLTALFCLLLAILYSQTAQATADIAPTSFLLIDPASGTVPARGEATYKVVVASMDDANQVVDGNLNVPIPAGFTFVSIDDTSCSYSAPNIHCDWSTITSQKIVIFKLKVPDNVNDSPYTLTAYTSADDNDTYNTNLGNDEEDVKTKVIESADLTLTKTKSDPLTSPVPGGSIVTYAFTVHNNGPYPASSLTVTDILPAGLTFVADDASPSTHNDSYWNCSAVGQNVTCTAASLAINTDSIFHFRVQITDIGLTGTISNTASVSATTPDPDLHNTATDILSVINGTDVAITKTVDTNPVVAEHPVKFTLTATNHGMDAAGVVVTDTLPVGRKYTDIAVDTHVPNPDGWSCTIDGSADPQTITCNPAASFANGATATFTITATPPAIVGTDPVGHMNTAAIATTTPDPITDNNSATAPYNVLPNNADLRITKVKTPSAVVVGEQMTSTIRVHNAGPSAASPIQVVDTLAAGETFANSSGTNWICVHTGSNPGGIVTCDYKNGSDFISLPNGVDTTVSIITTATVEGTLTNTACTGGGGTSTSAVPGDPNLSNNCVNGTGHSTTEENSADVKVSKSTSDSDRHILASEDSFSYIITVTNTDATNNTAEAIDFRDTIPEYIAANSHIATPLVATFVSPDFPSGTCATSAADVQCSLGNLAPGASATVTITVSRPMKDGTFTNTASAYSTLTGDPDRNNNVSSVDVTVDPVADIEVASKSVTYANTANPIFAETIATYNIQVRNNGPSTAKSVNLADVFSGADFDYISAKIDGVLACTYSAPNLTCPLGDMVDNTVKSINVEIRPRHNSSPPNPWKIFNTATVSMDLSIADSNLLNNSKPAELLVKAADADLSITKDESASFTEPVRFGEEGGNNYIIYKVSVFNNGPSRTTGVTFTDQVDTVFPAQTPNIQKLIFIRDTEKDNGTAGITATICTDPVNGNEFPVGTNTITCTLPDGGILESGAAPYIRYLVFQVQNSPNSPQGDTYHDVATVHGNEPDSISGNNTEDESTTVRTVADLGIVKEGPLTTVEVDEHFNYTLTVTNYGPGLSPNTIVTDSLPAGVVLTGTPTVALPGTCTGTADGILFSCNLGDMAADKDIHVTITVPVKVTTWPGSDPGQTSTTAQKHNCASVSGQAPEPLTDPHPNQGCADITYFKPATLGDFVWLDSNANGIQDNGEPGISGVTVNLLNNVGTPVATTTTDPAGAYSFTINSAADYTVEFVKTDATWFFSPKDVAPATDETDSDATTGTGRTDAITVHYGDAITKVDAGLYQQVSLGDRVWHDSNADGTQDAGELGISGVSVTLYSAGPDNTFWTGDEVAVNMTTTDADGLYSFTNLTPGDYAVQITPPAGLGYVPSPVQIANPNNDINTDSNINLVPAPQLPPTGSYRSYVITLSSQSEPTTDGETNNTNLTLDLGLVLPGSIGNLVWLDEDSNGKQDAGEAGIANVTVELWNSTGTTRIATTTTDAHGGYLFTGVTPTPGTYRVKVVAASLPTGMSQTTTYSTAGTDFANQNQSGFGYSVQLLTSAGKNLTADFGYNWSPTADVTGGINKGAIGNRVWIDHNGNGIQDPGETGVKGVELTLFTAGVDGLFWTGDDVTVATTTTADDGSYIFDNLAAGAYAVRVTGSGMGTASHYILDSSLYTQTGDPDHFAANAASAQAGTAGDHESTIPIILAPGDTFINVDFGYQPTGAPLYSIGNTVWLDSNRDGIMNPSESGIEGVVVGLKNADGKFIATTTTNDSGQYLFTDLPDGVAYTVVIIDSENMLTGMRATYDKDGGTSTPNGQSTITTLIGDDFNQNFGYVPRSAEAGTGAIGDTIFLDRDGDGTVDIGEGMEGVRVSLKDAAGATTTTFTNKNGRYFFGGLAAGTYTVAVDTTTLPAGLTNTVDPDGGTVSTSSVTILAAGIDMIQDFGYRAATPGTIGNLVWKDRNADGICQLNGLDGILGNADDETPLAGVTIELYRDLGTTPNSRIDFNEPLIAVTTTDAGGAYLFSQLPAGRYNVKVTDTNNVLEGFWHSLRTPPGTDNNSQTDYYPVNLASGGAIAVADFGYYYQPGSIGNRVWKDVDVDGLYDGGADSAIAYVTVNLAIRYPNGTTTTIKTLTDTNGNYLFQNLLLDEHQNGILSPPESYGTNIEPRHTITIDETTIPAPLVSIYPTRTRITDSTTVGGAESDEDTNDLGSDTPGGEPAYPPKGSPDITNDFGYFHPSSLGDKVWNDTNSNGIQDIGESGRMGVSVHLLDGSGNPVNNPLLPGVPYILPTDASGNYRFTYLLPGTYQVQFVLPADRKSTRLNSSHSQQSRMPSSA